MATARSTRFCDVCVWNTPTSLANFGAWMEQRSEPRGVRRGAEKKGSKGTGRSRIRPLSRGVSTKIHLLCDRDGNPLHFHLTAGQTHESTVLDTLLEGVDANLFDEEGKPIAWPVAMAGDKGYRADWIDEYLLDLGITPVIPTKKNDNPDARPLEFDRDKYKERNIVERLIGWLKENRRIFSRFEKTAKNFGGFLKMAFIHRYLRA